MLTIREEVEVLQTERKTLDEYWEALKIKRECLKKQLLDAEYAVKETELTREIKEFRFDDEINDDRTNGRNGKWTNETARKDAKRRMQLESEEWKEANRRVEAAKFKVDRLKIDLSTIEDDIKKIKPTYEAITAEITAFVAFQEADTAQIASTQTIAQAKRRLALAQN